MSLYENGYNAGNTDIVGLKVHIEYDNNIMVKRVYSHDESIVYEENFTKGSIINRKTYGDNMLYSLEEFNDKLIIKDTIFEDDGCIESITEYKYESKDGLVVKRTTYENNEITSVTQYEYQDKYLTKSIEVSDTMKYVNLYNQDELLLKSSTYDDQGDGFELNNIKDYKYKNQCIIKETVTDSFGDINYTEYEYNDDNFCIKETIYEDGEICITEYI
jgi:hypothetical protein